jgi:hypothetical protein
MVCVCRRPADGIGRRDRRGHTKRRAESLDRQVYVTYLVFAHEVHLDTCCGMQRQLVCACIDPDEIVGTDYPMGPRWPRRPFSGSTNDDSVQDVRAHIWPWQTSRHGHCIYYLCDHSGNCTYSQFEQGSMPMRCRPRYKPVRPKGWDCAGLSRAVLD